MLFEVHRTLESGHLFESTPTPRALQDTSPPDGTAGVGPSPVAGYEFLTEVGRGGMGVVYKARQLSLNRIVAIKRLRDEAFAGPEQLGRFHIEAAAIARLQHPNIVQIHEVGQREARPYLVLEFVDGTSLSQRLGGTPQPARSAAELVEALARAIHHAHQHGIIHRDLKPANVLLTADGVPKISDFGLAKLLQGEPTGVSQSGVPIGTASYIPPEQAQGQTQAKANWPIAIISWASCM
jgi:serine/threonine protein kinase